MLFCYYLHLRDSYYVKIGPAIHSSTVRTKWIEGRSGSVNIQNFTLYLFHVNTISYYTFSCILVSYCEKDYSIEYLQVLEKSAGQRKLEFKKKNKSKFVSARSPKMVNVLWLILGPVRISDISHSMWLDLFIEWWWNNSWKLKMTDATKNANPSYFWKWKRIYTFFIDAALLGWVATSKLLPVCGLKR